MYLTISDAEHRARADRRVEFIRESLVEVDTSLRELSGLPEAGLIVVHGLATDLIPSLANELRANAVFYAHDYEPQSLARDATVGSALAELGIVGLIDPAQDKVCCCDYALGTASRLVEGGELGL